jgi:glucose/arabinose dehydrogenase
MSVFVRCAAVLVAGLLVACGEGGEAPELIQSTPTAELTASATSPTPVPETTTTATPTVEAEDVPLGPVSLEPIAPDIVFERPVAAFALDSESIMVAEQAGVIYRVVDDERSVVVDLSDRAIFTGGEDGLLSVRPDPDYASNSHVWIYYFAEGPNRTVLSRFAAVDDATIDPDSELVILEVSQPYRNHNGGAIRFGLDGMLYLGFGDGGGPGGAHSQDRSLLLSTIIRIDVSGATEAEPYRVPADNPFVGEAGVPPEIWAYGLRNPWRMNFDAETGLLWVADVGQNAVEEVSIATAGANLGWRIMEGDRCHEPPEGCNQERLTIPVAVYSHEDGNCSITGGPVVRDSDIPGLNGTYLFADLCSEHLWGLDTSLDEEPVLLLDDAGPVASLHQIGKDTVVVSFGKPLQRLVSASES